MPLLTEKKLGTIIDIPVSLPAVEIRQGDWLVVASIQLQSPMRLTFSYLNFELQSANVDVDDVDETNKITSNLGLAFIGLYRDYTSGYPGIVSSLDVTTATALGNVLRTTPELTYTTAGLYTFIVANNMQASATSSIDTSTSIDLVVSATGTVRLELDSN